MIGANFNIILLNKKLDRESRRDVYLPTQISGVSFYHNRQSRDSKGIHSPDYTYKIRIPINAQIESSKGYITESQYDTLTAGEAARYWTLHTEDIIIVLNGTAANVQTDSILTRPEVDALAASNATDCIVHIVDYADNTRRGSRRVQHWRIGGA